VALLDPLFNGLARFIDGIAAAEETIENPDIGGEQATEAIGGALESATPADEVAGAVVDTLEEAVLDELDDAGEITPENVEDIADETEGGAVAVLAGLGLTGSAVEAASLGQVDQHQEYITQALAGLGVDDVTGLELEARTAEGIKPAMNAKVNAEHRAKFVDLQDVVEQDLRNKDSDTGYISDIGTYGIRPDNVPILEEVAINDIEFEELIETPAELGLPVPPEILQAELDRAGYAEPTKEFLQETADQIPRSARAYQELIVSEDLVSDLDQRVEDGTLAPDEAVTEVPDEVPANRDALRQRFRQRDALDPQAPSQSDFIDALVEGYTSLEETRDRLDQAELDTERYEDVLKAEIVGDLDGSLQTAVGTGRLSEGRFSDLAEFTGVDDQVIELLLQGQSLSDIASARLQEATSPAERSVRTLVGIGESRAAALDAAGLGTVQALAQADVDTVAETAQVSPETAQDFIQQAQQRIQ